jgi:group I intron endonuclease
MPRKGQHCSEKTKALLSAINRGSKNPFYGRKHKKETKKKMSLKALNGNNPFYRKHHTEETKLKMSIGQKKVFLRETRRIQQHVAVALSNFKRSVKIIVKLKLLMRILLLKTMLIFRRYHFPIDYKRTKAEGKVQYRIRIRRRWSFRK